MYIIPKGHWPPALAVPGVGIMRRPMFSPFAICDQGGSFLQGKGYADIVDENGQPLVADTPSPVLEKQEEDATPPPVTEVEEWQSAIAAYFQSTPVGELKTQLKGKVVDSKIEAILALSPLVWEGIASILTPKQVEALRQLAQST